MTCEFCGATTPGVEGQPICTACLSLPLTTEELARAVNPTQGDIEEWLKETGSK